MRNSNYTHIRARVCIYVCILEYCISLIMAIIQNIGQIDNNKKTPIKIGNNNYQEKTFDNH